MSLWTGLICWQFSLEEAVSWILKLPSKVKGQIPTLLFWDLVLSLLFVRGAMDVLQGFGCCYFEYMCYCWRNYFFLWLFAGRLDDEDVSGQSSTESFLILRSDLIESFSKVMLWANIGFMALLRVLRLGMMFNMF